MDDYAGKLSRRIFLKRTAALSASLGVGALLAACGGSATATVPAATTASKTTSSSTSAAGGGAATTSAASTTAASSAVSTSSAAASSAASTTSAASSAASSAAASPAASPAGGGGAAVAVVPTPTVGKSFSGKLTAWGIVSFTKDGDTLLGQQMSDWGKANGVEVEYVALPGSDYTQKVAAAVETGAIPDVVMMSGTDTIYYAAQNRLVDITDVYNAIKGLGGGMWESLLPNVQVGDKIYSIPMEADLSVLYARLDLCQKATGQRQAPATYDEMDAIMRKVNDPPKLFGFGMTLGRTPDCQGNIQSILFADGGTLVDKDGNPAINSDGTVSALTRVQTWWKDKLIPPDSPSWDDSSNNQSYQKRQSCFVINPASIFAYLDQNDKDLLKDTTQAPLPKGKAGSFPGAGCWSWSVFSASKNIDAAKAMIISIMAPDKMEAVYEKVGGRWYPVYKDLANAKWWKDRPYFDDFPKVLASARPGWYPATATPKLLTQLSAVDQKRIYAEMVQDVVVNNKSPQDAAKTAQTKMEQAFQEAAK
jgi:multiple sugar transport system substrate-binding protein